MNSCLYSLLETTDLLKDIIKSFEKTFAQENALENYIESKYYSVNKTGTLTERCRNKNDFSVLMINQFSTICSNLSQRSKAFILGAESFLLVILTD